MSVLSAACQRIAWRRASRPSNWRGFLLRNLITVDCLAGDVVSSRMSSCSVFKLLNSRYSALSDYKSHHRKPIDVS